MTARPIRYQRQVSDRNGKNFLHFYYFFITHKQIQNALNKKCILKIIVSNKKCLTNHDC